MSPRVGVSSDNFRTAVSVDAALSRLLVGEAIHLPHDGAPQAAQPIEEEIVLVVVPARKVSRLVVHARTLRRRFRSMTVQLSQSARRDDARSSTCPGRR